MFARSLQVTYSTDVQDWQPVPLAWLDSFCMRNFTNKAIFDDTLPTADGRIEAGLRVPLQELAEAMQAWLHRKARLPPSSTVRIIEDPEQLL